MNDLHGRVALITGAAQGQGEAAARLFADLGARVVIADVHIDLALSVAGAIGAESAMAVELDVQAPEQWSVALESVVDRFGTVDILINNAGLHRPARLLESTFADLESMFRVNVASVAALAPAEMSSLYGTTKAGVVNLTKGAALELGPRGVRVNCILPGGIDTRTSHERSRAYFDTIPLGRLAQPIEVAKVVAFFASDDSSYCTGSVLTVDGGWTLGPTMLTLRGPDPA